MSSRGIEVRLLQLARDDSDGRILDGAMIYTNNGRNAHRSPVRNNSSQM